MRSKYRTTLVALVAIAAFAAVSTASAMAEEGPHFSKTLSGKVTGHGRSAFDWQAALGSPWAYSTAEFNGEMSSTSSFDNFSWALSGGPVERGCDNGEGSGHGDSLKIAGLDARLGWINKSKKEVGLMFYPPKQPMATCYFYLFNEPGEIRGEVIAKVVSPGINERSKKLTLDFTWAEAHDTQNPQYFEGEKKSAEIFPLEVGNSQDRLEATGVNDNEVTFELPSELEMIG
jgi:hypothetical protein